VRRRVDIGSDREPHRARRGLIRLRLIRRRNERLEQPLDEPQSRQAESREPHAGQTP